MNRDTREEQIRQLTNIIRKEEPNLSEKEALAKAKGLVCSVRVRAEIVCPQTGLPVVVEDHAPFTRLVSSSGERRPLVLADDDRRFQVLEPNAAIITTSGDDRG